MLKQTGPNTYVPLVSWSHGTYNCLKTHYYWRTEGDETSNFHRRKSKGEILPLNWYDQQEHKITLTEGPWSITTPDGSTTYAGPELTGYHSTDPYAYLPTVSEVDSIIDKLNTDSIVKGAIASLYASGWDGLTFAAEFSKTVKLFRGATGRLLRLLSSTNPKDWAQLWLEGRYGWRLLYYDMVDITNLVTSINEKKRAFYHKRVGNSLTGMIERTPYTMGDSAWTGQWHVEHYYNYSLRGFAITSSRPPKVQINPVTTTWEIIPWSFVIDWFIDVGTTLEALSGLMLDSNMRSAYGVQIDTTTQCYLDASTINGWTGYVLSRVDGACSYTQRVPYTPSVLPQFNLNLDGYKVTDLLAILFQQLRR